MVRHTDGKSSGDWSYLCICQDVRRELCPWTTPERRGGEGFKNASGFFGFVLMWVEYQLGNPVW